MKQQSVKPNPALNQTSEFHNFLRQVAQLELTGFVFSESFFARAQRDMPLYSSRIENLKRNIGQLHEINLIQSPTG